MNYRNCQAFTVRQLAAERISDIFELLDTVKNIKTG